MEKTSYKDNWPLIGNKPVINLLEKSLATKKFSSSYIFHGVEDLGKATLAKNFAQRIIQADDKQSDLKIVEPLEEKKNISISQVRELINFLSLSSFNNSYKIGIIKQAEALSLGASNALLKTLEEPRKKSLIILVTSDLEAFPQTIVSRSQLINFYSVSIDEIYNYLINNHEVSRSQAKNLAHLSLGKPALALKFLENQDFYNQYLANLKIFLDFFQQDTSERLNALEKFLNFQAKRNELSKVAKNLISTWTSVLRDLLLLDLNQPQLVNNEIYLAEMKNIYSQAKPLKPKFDLLENSHNYIEQNVNPKVTLEQIAINL